MRLKLVRSVVVPGHGVVPAGVIVDVNNEHAVKLVAYGDAVEAPVVSEIRHSDPKPSRTR